MTKGPSETDADAELQSLRAERDALAKRLADSDRLLRQVHDHSPIPVSIISVTEAKYVYVNQAHCEFHGRPREYFFESDPYQVWLEITPPEELERERPLFQQLADGEREGYSILKQFRLPSGKLIPGELHLSASRDAAGHLHQLVGITRDLRQERSLEADKQSLEAQLRRSQKLEVMGRMAGGVAHDFNNRLLIVMGYAELLRSEVESERARGFVDMIVTSAERSAELTQQLLAFSRRQVLSPKSLDVAATMRGMQRLLESWLSERVRLSSKLQARERLWCDPGQLEQVILNLVINARDAMPEGGELVLASRDVEPGSSELPAELSRGSFVAIEVKDTGTGIPAHVLPHIFEPFYTTKPLGQGTGLGLATVEGIVRQSGGHVAVQTHEGQGTTVSVFLPVAPEVATEAPAPISQLGALTSSGRMGTILVCDDDEAVRALIGDVLAVGAYRVLAASDPDQALELMHAEGKVDLLVTDVVMPRQTGPELTARLRRDKPDLPVLYVSGYADEKSLASIAGEEFLPKPFRPAVLLTRVRQLLDARAARSAGGARAPQPKPDTIG